MRQVLAAGLLLWGCDVAKKVELPKELPKIVVPALPMLNATGLGLPKTVDGKYLLMELTDARLEIDPTVRDPLTALGECADQVSYCYAPGERTLDECVRSVRTCSTSSPWLEPIGCCPKACQDRYAAVREAGTASDAALDQVLFVEHDCFPGVLAALEGK